MRRAVLLSTLSSLAIPLLGLLTQPLLARSLGVEGRGLLAAALAPAALITAVATLGLPEALTYLLAKRPNLLRHAVASAVVLTLLLASLCSIVFWILSPYLSAQDPVLASWMLLGAVLSAPALVVGALRGAASGLQLWTAVAVERMVGAVMRVAILGFLWLSEDLTVFTAFLTTLLSPIIAGVIYSSMLLRRRPSRLEPEVLSFGSTGKQLLSYGSRIWIGAVAEMFLGRVGQLLVGPLSSTRELGLYSVAATIADVPIIAALAVQSAVFGVSSRDMDKEDLGRACRVTFTLSAISCALLASTLTIWLTPVFGTDFADAVSPTAVILLSAVICVPGLLAASGISAWGRPGLRSVGLVLTLLFYSASLSLLVPAYGALGAALTSLLANLCMTSFMLIVLKRVVNVSAKDMVVLNRSDVSYLSRSLRLYSQKRRTTE